MAKNKLQVAYDFDFSVMALNANVRPYKLAWSLNQKNSLSLAKEENIKIEFSAGKRMEVISYLHKGEYQSIRLLKNRALETEERFDAFLIPEMKSFDYLLILENESSTFDEKAFFSKIKEISFVQFATMVDVHTLKSRDNLIF